MAEKQTRRNLLRVAGNTLLGMLASADGRWLRAETEMLMAEAVVDHLLLGTPDLDLGMSLVREKTGISPIVGGIHPGAGTRNALLPLGNQYLEIIAPDPAQKVYSFRMDLRTLREPRLITWAALTNDIDATSQKAKLEGLSVIGPADGSRSKPDGVLLTWKTLSVENSLASATVLPVPFFIQWGKGVQHPSRDLVTGCVIESLEFEHANDAGLAELLRKLGIKAKVKRSAETRLTAAIRTPKGRWVLT